MHKHTERNTERSKKVNKYNLINKTKMYFFKVDQCSVLR